jgi:phosphoserine phosphatase RsbU/P
MNGAVALKHAGLDDEAIAIHAATGHLLHEHGPNAVQGYIESVCDKMQDSWSPQHFIAVRLRDGAVYTAGIGERSDELVTALEAASQVGAHRADFDDRTFVAGEHSGNGISVYASESLSNIRRSIRREGLMQVAVLGLLGLLAAGIVNIVLLRMVNSPLKRLLETVEQISSGHLGAEARSYGSREMQDLSRAVNSMSRSLMKHDEDRRAQMARARDIQQHLLPRQQHIPGLRTAHLFEPADEVAGDYYDFVRLPDHAWLICVADVTGHGVPAAMGAAMLKTLLLIAAEESHFSLVSILQQINRRFAAAILPGNFATMFLAKWQPKSSVLSWASAGHDSGILLAKSGRVDQLPSSGLPLGIDTNADWEEHSVELCIGDRILLYSDGATETRSPAGELLGRQRLVSWYSQYTDQSPDHTLVELSRALSEYRGDYPQNDDVTFVALECSPVTQFADAASESSQAICMPSG